MQKEIFIRIQFSFFWFNNIFNVNKRKKKEIFINTYILLEIDKSKNISL